MNNVFERLFGVHVDPEPTPDELNDVETLNLSDYDGELFEEPEVTYPELFPARVTIDPSDGYTVISHGRWYATAVADAAGQAVIVMPPPNVSMAWMIDRIGTQVTGGTYTSLLVTEGDSAAGVILDVSRQVPDIADENQPIWVEGLPINFTAVGMTPTETLMVTVQYRMARRLNESVGM